MRFHELVQDARKSLARRLLKEIKICYQGCFYSTRLKRVRFERDEGFFELLIFRSGCYHNNNIHWTISRILLETFMLSWKEPHPTPPNKSFRHTYIHIPSSSAHFFSLSYSHFNCSVTLLSLSLLDLTLFPNTHFPPH